MYLFLPLREDLDLNWIANRAMNTLTACNPAVASHCEKANIVKGRLENVKAEINKEFQDIMIKPFKMIEEPPNKPGPWNSLYSY
jgi:hypothetical protein